MKRNSKSGQSILEYTLVLGAVIAVIVAVLLGPSGIKDKINATYSAAGTALETTSADLTGGIFQ